MAAFDDQGMPEDRPRCDSTTKSVYSFFKGAQAYPPILDTSDLFCVTRSIQLQVVSRLFPSKHVLSKSCQHGGTNGEYTTKCSCLLLTLQCLVVIRPLLPIFTQAATVEQ